MSGTAIVWLRQSNSPDFIANMKAFAQTGLTLEVANPRFDLIDATVRLTDKVPELRVVVGHLQALPLPTAPDVLKSYSDNLRELRKRNVYAKVSGLPRSGPMRRRRSIRRPTNPCSISSGTSSVKISLSMRRLVANASQPSPIERMKTNLKILQAYLMAKGRPAAEKFFWQNSVHAFRWVRRDPKQPQLA